MNKTFLLILLSLVLGTLKAQDILVKKNGDIITGRVLEVLSTEIKYKKTENLQGPLYSIPKNEVLSIRYQNGEKDIFEGTASLTTHAEGQNKTIVTIPLDELILKNGSDVKCRIRELDQNQIAYVIPPDSSTRSISKAEVFMIRYGSGAKEVLTSSVHPLKDTATAVKAPDTVKTNTAPAASPPPVNPEADFIHTTNGGVIEAIVDSMNDDYFFYRMFNSPENLPAKIRADYISYVKYSANSRFNKKYIPPPPKPAAQVPATAASSPAVPVPAPAATPPAPTPIAVKPTSPTPPDILVTMEGDEIEAEGIQVLDKEVAYKVPGKSGMVRLEKKNVFKIKRPDGTFTIINNPY